MYKAVLAFCLAISTNVFAQEDSHEVKLVTPDTFCKIEQFGPQKSKPAVPALKRCDKLKDKEELSVKSISECKQRALAKGEECLKLSEATEIAVSGKFKEKFAVSFNSTSFTCALSKGAGNDCP